MSQEQLSYVVLYAVVRHFVNVARSLLEFSHAVIITDCLETAI